MGAVNAGPSQCGVGKECGFVVGIVEVPVVKKHVLFCLSAVCFELNDFCLCCRLC